MTEKNFDALENRLKTLERNSHPPMHKNTSDRLEALEGINRYLTTSVANLLAYDTGRTVKVQALEKRIADLEDLNGPITIQPDGSWLGASGRTMGHK